MQFKHPELLYALFLLLIPIFIHLFQLRKFQKVAFTNVAFLKKVTIQTRKSSQLKKWLTLLTRLLALACIILAFSQPFSASKTAINTEKETVLYIDNSFSMQAKGNNGPLLERALQQLYSQPTTTKKISWFSNNYSKKNTSIQDFKEEILSVSYSQNQLKLNDVLLKANQLFSKNPTSEKRLIIVSDFQQKGNFPKIEEGIKVDIVQLSANSNNNISIDTAYIQKKNTGTLQLNVLVSAQGIVPKSIPVSLFNDHKLVAKTAVDFSNTSETNKRATVTFDITDKENFNGKIELTDANIQFDNTLFFNINTPKKIQVLSLNGTDAAFLPRIFNQEEFNYTQQSTESLNYSSFPTQNMIVINELNSIPESLSTALKSFSENGGTILVIPSVTANLEEYNSLFAKLNIEGFSELISQEKKITQIVFSHPIYDEVFEKQVVNFQYPKVNSFFTTNASPTIILKFEDQKPFLIQKKNTFVSTASFSKENSNFQSSPLIVPTLYNMAKQSLSLPKLYYEIGVLNQFSVAISLKQDEIVTIKDSVFSFIPLQQSKANQVNIITENEPSNSGIYSIEKASEFIENVSYNYNRSESTLIYADPKNWENISVYNSLEDLFESISEENNILSYWKWFVTFALLFLIIEMMLLKFLKN